MRKIMLLNLLNQSKKKYPIKMNEKAEANLEKCFKPSENIVQFAIFQRKGLISKTKDFSVPKH